MTEHTRTALAEARALLATCREQLGANGDPALALLAQAVERLADAIASGGTPTPAEDAGEPGPFARPKFDRARPHRGYNRGE
jgi:hypothetical protein